jgi:hypothetical protein
MSVNVTERHGRDIALFLVPTDTGIEEQNANLTVDWQCQGIQPREASNSYLR